MITWVVIHLYIVIYMYNVYVRMCVKYKPRSKWDAAPDGGHPMGPTDL